MRWRRELVCASPMVHLAGECAVTLGLQVQRSSGALAQLTCSCYKLVHAFALAGGMQQGCAGTVDLLVS